MNGLEILLVYSSGIISGLILAVGGILYITKKPLTKDLAGKKSVDSRFAKVRALTEEQLDMQAAATGPQKNALDGRYKNGLGARIKQIEEEKAQILQTILQDGFDPEVTVQGPDGLEKIRLSAFLVQQGYESGPQTKAEKATSKPKNPFTVVKGGKSDDGDGQTFH